MSWRTTWRWPWLLWFCSSGVYLSKLSLTENRGGRSIRILYFLLLHILLNTAAGEYGDKSIDLLYFWVA